MDGQHLIGSTADAEKEIQTNVLKKIFVYLKGELQYVKGIK